MEKVEVFKKMSNEQVIMDIKNDLDSIIPAQESEAISLDIAKRVFALFFDDSILTSPTGHDKEVLFAFSYFLSKDSEFKFTQTYLRGKNEAFYQCINQSRDSFRLMMIHFNRMIKYMGEELKPYRLAYHELFFFKFDKGRDRWIPMLQYKNIGSLISSKKNIFQVYIDTPRNPSVLVYTTEFTEKTKEDRKNLAVIFQRRYL